MQLLQLKPYGLKLRIRAVERLATMPSSTWDVFDVGKHTVRLLTLEPEPVKSAASSPSPPRSPSSPLKPLLVAAPSEVGDFPVLVLLHGYLLNNSFYTQLIQHRASHGFIVVAPQVIYLLIDQSITQHESLFWLMIDTLLVYIF